MRWDFRSKKIMQAHPGGRRVPFKNPLFRRGGTASPLLLALRGQPALAFLGFFTLAVSAAYLLFYSPVFQLTTIRIEGPTRIPPEEISRVVQQHLGSRESGIFLQSNFFTLSRDALRERIQSVYSFEKLEIRTKLLHTIILSVEERLSTIFFETQSGSFLVDDVGIVTQSAAEKRDGLITVSEEVSLTEPAVGDRVLTSESTQFMVRTSQRFTDNFGMTITRWILPSRESSRLDLETEAGWKIYFAQDKDLDAQYANALRVWNETLKSDPPDEYLDVRILDRVYFR